MQAGRLNILLQVPLDMERWELFFGGGQPHICRGRPLRPWPKTITALCPEDFAILSFGQADFR